MYRTQSRRTGFHSTGLRSGLRGFGLGVLVCLLIPATSSFLDAQSEVERLGRPADAKQDAKENGEPQEAEKKDEPEKIDPLDPLDAELDRLDGEGLGGAMDEITKLTREISENMKMIEKLLDQKNTGEQTQTTQTQTIEQIDKLIELVESASSSSGGGGGGGGKPQSSSTQEQDQRQGQKNRGMSPQQKQEQQGKQQESQGKRPEDSPNPTRNDQTSEGELPPDESGDLNPGPDGRGRWGRLPRTDIEKMYDNGRRQLPDKYRILLEEYFRRLPNDE